MRYVIANRQVAASYGFDASLHLVTEKKICLNEKEVMMNPRLWGDLEKRARTLSGSIHSRYGALNEIKATR